MDRRVEYRVALMQWASLPDGQRGPEPINPSAPARVLPPPAPLPEWLERFSLKSLALTALRLGLVLGVLHLLTGCGAPSTSTEPSAPAATETSVPSALPSAAAWQSPSSFVLSPPDELREAAEGWAARWAAASGLRIDVAPGGIPLALDAEILDEQGRPMCAGTGVVHGGAGEYRFTRMRLAVPAPDRCPGWQVSIGHELGHILAGPEAPHAATGIFETWLPVGAPAIIDESTLAAVCAFAPCTAFVPERSE